MKNLLEAHKPELQLEDPIGGWIKGFGADFDNKISARHVDFEKESLDRLRVEYFMKYLDEYYNSNFIYGQGTEHILAMGARNCTGGHWLDIGVGTSTLFWATAFRDIKSVSCVDLVIEALAVLNDFRKSVEIPGCYLEALEITGNTSDQLSCTRSCEWEYYTCNLFKPWSDLFARQTFDMLSAYAVFGLSADAGSYADCFKELYKASQGCKRILGADWVRSQKFIEHEGHDNTYVSTDLLVSSAYNVGFGVVECEEYSIVGDPLYDRVVSWVLSR